MFRKNPSEKFEKIVLRKEKAKDHCLIENLEELQDKSLENIQKVLIERLTLSEDFVFVGKNLLHLDTGSGKLDLLVKFIENVYEEMKKNKKTQVISLIGSSMKSKEINKNTVVAHLAFISTSNNEFMKTVQCAYEILNIFAGDGENLFFAECLNLAFDNKFALSGCEIVAKIVDVDLEAGLGIFRVLMSMAEATRQHLGLLGLQVDEKNIELIGKFKENLDFLGISWLEVVDLMEIVAVCVLLDKARFETNSFTFAGQKPCNTYNLVLSKEVMKVCKILGLVPFRFLECFTSFSKQRGLDMIEAFRKMMVIVAFDAFVKKVNVAIKKRAIDLRLGKSLYSLKVLTSPHAKTKSNIDGLISNIVSECFEFASYEQFLSILTTINEEKIPAKQLSVPRCRYILELFLDKSFGILANFNDQNFWRNLFNEISEDSVYNKILNIEDTNLTINFSWGSQSYHLPSLISQHEKFPKKVFSDLIKKSSHRLLLSSIHSFLAFDYKSYLNQVLSEILEPVSSLNTFIIFNFKDIKDMIFESSLLSTLRLPFKYLIQKTLIPTATLKKSSYKYQKTENFIISDENPSKILNLTKTPHFNISSVTVFSNSPLKGPTLTEYIDPVLKPVSKLPRCGSSKLSQRVFSVTSSHASTKFLGASLQNFKNYSWTSSLKQIIKIQSYWRGYKTRLFVKSLKKLNKAAIQIQKVWKGFRLRKVLDFRKIVNCVRFVQKMYKKWFKKKCWAARKIQQFFINKKYKFSFISRRTSNHLTYSGNFTFKTAQRSLERSKKFDNARNEFRFKPDLGKKTLQIVRKGYGEKKVRVEDRLIMKGKESNERKDFAIINKKRSEAVLRPSASVKRFNKRFYEDNLKFMNDKKNSLKDLRVMKNNKELINCTFKPTINSSNRSRSAMETINDLYKWKLKKDRKLEKDRQELENENLTKLKNFKASEKSSTIAKTKKQEENNKEVIASQIKQSMIPYWPSK